jgi:serine/threonine protein kinase
VDKNVNIKILLVYNYMYNNKYNTKSTSSLSSIVGGKKYDTFQFRKEFIRELLSGNNLEPMINFDSTATENFTGKFANQDSQINDDYSNDTRQILNKKLYNFYKVIHQIGGRLIYVKSGTTGHTFRGEVELDDGEIINYAVKVVAYPKTDRYGNINDSKRPENAELLMIRVLSYFFLKKQTPHITLPIGTFDTSIKPFINLVEKDIVDKDNKKYAEFISMYKEDAYYDHVSILIGEWANRGDFLDFVRKNYKEFEPRHWKVFFFQLLSVLAIIQAKYPGFRHNDLKANNILVHQIDVKARTAYTKYRVEDTGFLVPSIGYNIKLWDFDFACIPGIVDNSKVMDEWTNRINVKPEQNRYYDVHYFFNTFIKDGFFPQFRKESCIPQEARDFVNRIVPPKFQKPNKYVHKRGRLLANIEYLTPLKILREDPYFEEFRAGYIRRTKNKERKLKEQINNMNSPHIRKENIKQHKSRNFKHELDALINSDYLKTY